MKVSGSVLIVVLGLLAILAVIGITFVTMSNLDRRTAANFAIQSQFILAADGAVDYATHHMVQDLWAHNPQSNAYEDKLLSNDNENEPFIRNEPFDYPSPDWDPWLSQAVTDESMAATQHYSYKEQAEEYSGEYYGFRDWGDNVSSGERPNNLGFPDGGVVPTYVRAGQGHGGWIPELAAPFENGLIRISLTVIDHNAMINWNAHGNLESLPRGYYISDVNPAKPSFNSLIPTLLTPGGNPPGIWATAADPGNRAGKAVVIENPGKYGDRPLTLDEEFELRRLTGTFWNDSRVESFANQLRADPDTGTSMQAKNRLSVTTVSWTSESRPNVDIRTGRPAQPLTGGGRAGAQGYEWRKVDVNLDKADDIYNAISAAPIFDSRDASILNQFVANICGFRDGKDEACLQVQGKTGCLGASRQPLLSKAQATLTGTETDPNTGDVTKEIWTVEVQIISPWPNNCVGGADGLTISNITLRADGASKQFPALPSKLRCAGGQPVPETFSCEVELVPPETLASKLQSITLECNRTVIDRIDPAAIAKLAQTGQHRAISFEDEDRGGQSPEDDIRVVYIGGWTDGIGSGMGSWEMEEPGVKVPIRFPRSVLDPDDPPKGGLPPVWVSGISADLNSGKIYGFKAFPRIGDLNQVLCTLDSRQGANFWPWTTRVAAIADPKNEIDVKFCWKAATRPNTVKNESRFNLANVVTVGGPWHDRLDNDGDGYTDDDGSDTGQGPDAGLSKQERSGGGGKFGGPELRVAGKININTATPDTLNTLTATFQIGGAFPAAVMAYRQNQPFFSPAQILTLPQLTCSGTDAKGFVETSDLPYTRLSNILSVRSDTFSVYGTVQYGHVERSGNSFGYQLVRSRRFWALVDRSPALAYMPGKDPRSRTPSNNFVRPRVLNFQWMD